MNQPRLTSLAPQFLVDDLQRSIAYYRDKLGFEIRGAVEWLLRDRPKGRPGIAFEGSE